MSPSIHKVYIESVRTFADFVPTLQLDESVQFIFGLERGVKSFRFSFSVEYIVQAYCQKGTLPVSSLCSLRGGCATRSERYFHRLHLLVLGYARGL